MFEKYSEYKNSGVEWLGHLPDKWMVKKMKFLGFIYPGLSGKKGDDFSKDFQEHLKCFIPFTNICNNLKISLGQYQYVSIDAGETQNRVRKKDILFLMSSETLEEIAKCSIYLGNDEELYLNSFCKGFRIIDSRALPEYINYLLTSSTYRSYFSLVGRGFTRINLKQEFINDAFVPLPTKEEQTAIANFLDRKTAQIDQAISIKEKQIELLKERRQILIHNAVTRGLDSEVKMKDSGVSWIGEIPEHWEVKKLKYFSTVQSGITLGKNYVSKNLTSYPYLRVANVQSGYFNLEQIAEINLPNQEAVKYFVRKGDILVTEGGDLDKLGRGTVWMGAIENCLHQNHVFAVRVDTSVISPQFASILMESDYGRKYFTNTANKTTNLASTNSTKLGNFPVILAPKEEREGIFEYLKDVTGKIATAISLKQKEIEKLKEYKSTLINSAVTGKIKVS